jgi:Fe-S cluster assembly ATPase SufC
MKGQATAEFLFVFTATIAVMSILTGALIAQNEVAQERIDEIEHIQKAEAAARALEAWMNSGITMKFGFHNEDVLYRIENDSFHVSHEGKIIEIGGVFHNDRSEPL